MTGLRVLLLAAGLGTGCAYYNGLYNANRLADDARRAEREGRTGEARSLWSQAAIKAESVVVRFPNSKYRDDALLLQGTALFNVNACTQAVKPLAVAADSSPDADIRRGARIMLARCRMAMFEPDSARLTLAPLVAGSDSAVRHEALYLRGEAALALHDNAAALDDLQQSRHPLAVFPLAIALVRAGHRDSAGRVLAGAVRGPYQEDRWLATLDSVGLGHPHVTAPVVSALVQRPNLGSGQQARLLVGDGVRWQQDGDRARAAERFSQAVRTAPDSIEGRVAQTHLTVAAVRETDDPSRVAGLLDTLRRATERGGAPAMVGSRFVTILQRVAHTLGPDGTDLSLFVAAEDVRDTLDARPLAASLFVRVSERFPQSVIAPKALFAAAALQPAHRQDLVARALDQYPESVYVMALRGMASDAYAAVEDSLRQLIAEGLREGETGQGARRRGTPDERRNRNRQ